MRKTRDNMKDSQITDEIIDEVEDLAPEEGAVDERAQNAVDGDDRIGELERELTTERDKYLRLAAEFDNFRKRMMKERVEAEARGQAELVRHMLDPLDDIARFAHVDPATTESGTIVEGVAMVEKKLEKSLRAAGLELVSPKGEKFDPALHEAVATEPAASADEDHIVSQVYQVGYTFKGQLLRPARVVVKQFS
ncbi:MAG TPA: nucleotide exchange factor GrpE [Gemmatimonadaceae bacterium]|nr:nucleotide exchange factor GrpE [Gemmatimonadaceae bacterium]